MITFYEFEDNEEIIARAVIEATLSKHGIKIKDIDIDITILNIDDMRQLNMESRGIDNATDVLSYPTIEIKIPFKKKYYKADINPESGAVYLGELMICREIMIEQAVEYGHSEERELSFLTAHGIHHLLGYDHIVDSDRIAMRKSEEEILNQLNYTRK